jgi:hypothetical protein
MRAKKMTTKKEAQKFKPINIGNVYSLEYTEIPKAFFTHYW